MSSAIQEPCFGGRHVWTYYSEGMQAEPDPDDTCDCGKFTWKEVLGPKVHARTSVPGTMKATEIYTGEISVNPDWILVGHITINPNILPAIAAEMHSIWAHWMEYLFSKAPINDDGTATISAYHVERWHRQMYTPYAELTEKEQESDIEQAKKVLAAIFGVAPDLKPEEWK